MSILKKLGNNYRVLLRHGESRQVPDAELQLGEIVYLTDKECIGVGDGKGGLVSLTEVVRGPEDALYMKVADGYAPLVIKSFL